MIAFAFQQSLQGLVRLVATTVMAAGWAGSSMSWSPDARWLSYTVAPEPATVERPPGWLFDAPRPPTPPEARPRRDTSAAIHPVYVPIPHYG